MKVNTDVVLRTPYRIKLYLMRYPSRALATCSMVGTFNLHFLVNKLTGKRANKERAVGGGELCPFPVTPWKSSLKVYSHHDVGDEEYCHRNDGDDEATAGSVDAELAALSGFLVLACCGLACSGGHVAWC